MSRAIIWATGGAAHAAASGAAIVASSHGLPVTATTKSTYIGGASTGYVTPTTEGATSVEGSSFRPNIGSGIASIAGCSATSEGVP